MKIDLTQKFFNADDTPAIDAGTGKHFELKDILIQVLLNPQAQPGEKVKRYSLYRDVKKSMVGYVMWDAEDVALVKAAVLHTHPTLVTGQVHEMMEREWIPTKVPHAIVPPQVPAKIPETVGVLGDLSLVNYIEEGRASRNQQVRNLETLQVRNEEA